MLRRLLQQGGQGSVVGFQKRDDRWFVTVRYTDPISTKVNFLLDATLGLINNEQNGIIKIVSVAAVGFLPPTLVASVYGMNFEVMPELKWVLGYPFAVFLMISSAVLPYVFFKRKGWL
jgi:magnesium transporter